MEAFRVIIELLAKNMRFVVPKVTKNTLNNHLSDCR